MVTITTARKRKEEREMIKALAGLEEGPQCSMQCLVWQQQLWSLGRGWPFGVWVAVRGSGFPSMSSLCPAVFLSGACGNLTCWGGSIASTWGHRWPAGLLQQKGRDGQEQWVKHESLPGTGAVRQDGERPARVGSWLWCCMAGTSNHPCAGS